MSAASAPIGVGTKLVFDGELMEIVELGISSARATVVLRDGRGQMRMAALTEVLGARRGRVLVDEPGPDSTEAKDPATVALSLLSDEHRAVVRDRTAHVQEILTGFRSGSAELAEPGEPQPSYAPGTTLMQRYHVKAKELGVTVRTLSDWVARFRSDGPAGLVPGTSARPKSPLGRVDRRWSEMAVDVLAEFQTASRPSRSHIIERTHARVAVKYGPDVVPLPSRSAAFRALTELEKRYPTFRLSTKRNRDIASRPDQVYGKLRPTRPGQYLLMDSTRLDVFALDPVTLRWMQAELTVAMDWYTRCITGLRVTPVSTKSVDAAAVLYQTYRPTPPGVNWPPEAVWPEHGVPRSVLIDVDAIESTTAGASGPAIVPETLVVDHGKIYLSEHLTSVCQRLGVSIQPARLRTGRDKGPIERFFRTVREDLLQILPGYKGPDVYSRGLDVEKEAILCLNELEAIIREWIAVEYHRRPHSSLVDPHLPGLRMTPEQMFEHGISRAGYIEAPRDPDLAYEFLKTEWRTIQHYGVEIDGCIYKGQAVMPYHNMTSPYGGKARGRWPFQVDPDNINVIYFRDPESRQWHQLIWEHAAVAQMPFSRDALDYARELAAKKYRHSNDRLAVANLLERWKLGLGMTLAERRIALRQSRLDNTDGAENNTTVEQLPSVAHALSVSAGTEPGGDACVDTDDSQALSTGAHTDPECGDDDSDDETEGFEGSDAATEPYPDVWEDV